MTEPRRVSKQSKIALAIAAVAGVSLAVWLTLAPNRIIAPEPGTQAPSDPRAAIEAEVPGDLSVPVDSVTPGTRALAPTLPNEPAEVAEAIAAAHADGRLPARRFPAEAPGIPRMAGALGDALVKKQVMPASSFELATLLGGVLKTRGGVVEYGRVPARHDATELLARRYVTRLKGGPWLAADGGPIEGAVLLAELDLLGYTLAYRALGAAAKGDADTASRAAGLARRLLPDDPAVAFAVAEAEIANDLPDEARRTFDAAARVGADGMTWYRLGQRARAEQRPFVADDDFKKAIAADPAFAAPHVALAELSLERLDVSLKDQHPKLIEAANQAIAEAEKIDPKAVGIRLVKAHLLSLEEKGDEARAQLEEEVKLHPEEPMSFVMLANVYAAEQKDAEALKTLEDARAHGHETADVLEGLGQLYGMQGRFAEAKEVFERALEVDPENRQYRIALGQIERQLGNVAKARKYLEAQLDKFPDDAMAAILLAQLELADGQPLKAQQQIDKILARDPSNKEAILFGYLIGVVAEKPDPAARARAIAAVGSRSKLAGLLTENGLWAEAEVVLEEALTAEADDLQVPVMLVGMYFATGREADSKTLREATLAKVEPAEREALQKEFEQSIAQAVQAKNPPPEPLDP